MKAEIQKKAAKQKKKMKQNLKSSFAVIVCNGHIKGLQDSPRQEVVVLVGVCFPLNVFNSCLRSQNLRKLLLGSWAGAPFG